MEAYVTRSDAGEAGHLLGAGEVGEVSRPDSIRAWSWAAAAVAPQRSIVRRVILPLSYSPIVRPTSGFWGGSVASLLARPR